MSENHIQIVRMAYEVGYLNRRVDIPGVGDRFEEGYLLYTRWTYSNEQDALAAAEAFG